MCIDIHNRSPAHFPCSLWTPLAPVYLCFLVAPTTPTRSFRSSDSSPLQKPTFKLKSMGGCSFSISVPRLWNKLPLAIRISPTLDCFKKSLKTHLFKVAYCLWVYYHFCFVLFFSYVFHIFVLTIVLCSVSRLRKAQSIIIIKIYKCIIIIIKNTENTLKTPQASCVLE